MGAHCPAVFPSRWLRSRDVITKQQVKQAVAQRTAQHFDARFASDPSLWHVPRFTAGDKRDCPHCGTPMFSAEVVGNYFVCCSNGAFVIGDALWPQVPDALLHMYNRPLFVRYCRTINTALRFAAVGTSPTRTNGGRGFHALGFPSMLKVQGSVYCLNVPADVRGPFTSFMIQDSCRIACQPSMLL